MIFVFDTNLLVSALLKPGSVPDQALELATRHGALAFSGATRDEFMEVIRRPKFDRYIRADERDKAVKELLESAVLKEPTTQEPIECRDPKDVKFLRLALEARPACIVSGDRHLLELNPFRGIPVYSPTEFLQYVDTFRAQ